jgi:hypothetical protein
MFSFSCNFYEEAYRNSCRKFAVCWYRKMFIYFLSLYYIYLTVGELEAGHTEHNLTECDHEILKKKNGAIGDHKNSQKTRHAGDYNISINGKKDDHKMKTKSTKNCHENTGKLA